MKERTKHTAWYFIIFRTAIPAGLTVILVYWTFFYLALPAIEDNLMRSKRETIREVTNTAASILKNYHQQVEDGIYTLVDAKQKAIKQISQLRYGPDNKDYFFINDMQPIMIMHPYRPELVGTDITFLKDPNGKRIFVDFVDTARKQRSGFVSYMWQWKDDQSRIVPKLSYVTSFEPWQWVIGSGIYIDDVEKTIQSFTSDLTRILTRFC